MFVPRTLFRPVHRAAGNQICVARLARLPNLLLRWSCKKVRCMVHDCWLLDFDLDLSIKLLSRRFALAIREQKALLEKKRGFGSVVPCFCCSMGILLLG
jgi:hypothetical protein